MFFTLPLHRMNKFASAAILPLMVLAIVAFSNAAAKDEVVAMPVQGTLVIANLRAESLTIHDLRAGQTKEIVVPGPPHELAWAGGRIHATLGRANLLAEVDLNGPSLLRLTPLDGTPHGIAVSGDQLLVTQDTAGRVTTFDRASLAPLGSAATGDTPHTVAVAGKSVFVTDSRDDRLRQLPSGATLQTGVMPESVAVVGPFVVTADNVGGTLGIFADEPFSPVGTVRLGGGPVRVIPLDDRRVLVALNAGGEVAVVDVKARKVERRITVAERPDGLCLSPDGTFVAVVSNAAGVVQFFRVRDGRRAGSLAAGDGAGACAWLSR